MGVARAWRNAEGVEATREFFSQRAPRGAAIRGLMREIVSEDRFARRCAADLARRVSEREPGILRQYASVLIDLAAEAPLEDWQTRGYMTLAAARNAATRSERMRLALPVRAMIDDERNALRAIALEAFALLAAGEPELRDEALAQLELARGEGTCAMRSRARRMLRMLLSADASGRGGRARQPNRMEKYVVSRRELEMK